MDPGPSINFIGIQPVQPFPASQDVSPVEVSFGNEIKSMLFAFGDSRNPKPETASLIEEICQQQMAEIVVRASEVASSRGSSTIGIEDLLFLMRRSPIKIQRLVKYLGVLEVVGSLKLAGSVDDPSNLDGGKRIRRCREFLRQIDTDPRGILSRAANEELVDEARLERLRRLDRFSRDMDERRYSEFTRARKVSFLGHHFRLSQNFQEWILQAIPIDAAVLPFDRSCLEGLGYLAYETVGQLVDVALVIRHEESNTDPVLRQMAPQVFNSSYRAEVTDHIMDDKFIVAEPSFSRPLEPKHVTEAIRRLGHRGLPVGRVSKFIELIAV